MPILLPAAPILTLNVREACRLSPDGEVETLDHREAAQGVTLEPPLVCHGVAVAKRLGFRKRIACYDVLELWAFVRPARFTVPTVRGLARALGLPLPTTLEAEAVTLLDAARLLLQELADPSRDRDPDARAVAEAMHRCGWPWGRPVLTALGVEDVAEGGRITANGLAVWRRLPPWEEEAPPPPPADTPVAVAEAQRRLLALLGGGAEEREQQHAYAGAITPAFQPRETEDDPAVVLAEAGTGVGKTLGYIAPASVWSEKTGGTVWLSTYTRNLQRQLDQELDRLYPDPAVKADRVVVRKGRENYLCLLNLEEAVQNLPLNPQDGVALGLMVRWAAATRDGDLMGGDFPSWLAHLLGRQRTLDLVDHRGECIYSACAHYGKCFIERTVRRARKAKIVVANHALVMVQAALGGDAANRPLRYVFDEGHHLFDAADGTFAAHLSGQEMQDLRRWLVGAETGRRSRARGLKARIEDLVAGDDEAVQALDAVLTAARTLPAEAWRERVREGRGVGAAEGFLSLVRQQVYARAPDTRSPYSLEVDTNEPVAGLLDAAARLDTDLHRLQEPLAELGKRLARKLTDEAEHLDTAQRNRIEAMVQGLERRGHRQLAAWRAMLKTLGAAVPEAFVDWLAVERHNGHDQDVGLYRHWIDPTEPFVHEVVRPSHGALITSATLRDGSGEPEADWAAAEARTGARHLLSPPVRTAVSSPFAYADQTRVFIVNDVRKDDLDQVAAAYRALFQASGGGALGLFTAIGRLRGVHERIAEAVEAAGCPLYAQHVDGIDTATLIDIFREEENACLLGTDAVRDGVDVPGRSLRLLVFDRVPWPRPDIVHRARRPHFGKRRYDDMITRLRLKQAFGRLVRRADDHGVFVLLDPMMPSRLLGAFPDGVAVRRCGLAEAVAETRAFLSPEEGSVRAEGG